MRRILIALLIGTSLAVVAADAVTGKVVKVLPLLLDTQGRVAKSPSLFDRDAYQAWLRIHTNEISGIRYDVLWKAGNTAGEKLKLRIELHGLGESNQPAMKTIETDVSPGFASKWTELTLVGEDYKNFGGATAWRTTLWDGDTLLGEQKSFLW